jgi:hypothetical protein
LNILSGEKHYVLRSPATQSERPDATKDSAALAENAFKSRLAAAPPPAAANNSRPQAEADSPEYVNRGQGLQDLRMADQGLEIHRPVYPQDRPDPLLQQQQMP